MTNITIGLKYKKTIIVEPKDSAKVYGSGLVDVYSTPAMIALMEQTCNELLQPHLNENEVSVGIEVNVKHIKATNIGDSVTCYSEIVEISKNKITFKVETFDSKGKIGEGIHKRAIVNKEFFLNNL
jgi:predicted thioesterase